jgi:para-nitrobenzyl esterase
MLREVEEGDRVVVPGATVHTAAGAVQGYRRAGVEIFKGMAYAGAPTVEHRFRRAPPLAPWPGVRNAYSYGPVCPRWTAPDDLAANEWVFLLQRGAESAELEDCLRINVWTRSTRPDRLRPVMVWLHGQGFMSGSSQDFLATDGESLARNQDVVVMSLNHRVGPLGLLHLGELLGSEHADSGNLCMLDIVDALHWVRLHAERFGGDPGNVTLFGQSGGGFKISVLLAMPEAKGLFHKAIIQSGARLRVHTRASATELAERTLHRLGQARPSLEPCSNCPCRSCCRRHRRQRSRWPA